MSILIVGLLANLGDVRVAPVGFETCTVVLDRGAELEVMCTETTRRHWLMLFAAAPEVKHQCDAMDCPIGYVTGYGMLAFANALSAASGVGACYRLDECTGEPWEEGFSCATVETAPLCDGFMLPVWSEWEALLANGPAECTDSDCLQAEGWHRENADMRAHPVGEKRPSSDGLVDLVGNVAEAVWDTDNPYALHGRPINRTGGGYPYAALRALKRGLPFQPLGYSGPAYGFRVLRRL